MTGTLLDAPLFELIGRLTCIFLLVWFLYWFNRHLDKKDDRRG